MSNSTNNTTDTNNDSPLSETSRPLEVFQTAIWAVLGVYRDMDVYTAQVIVRDKFEAIDAALVAIGKSEPSSVGQRISLYCSGCAGAWVECCCDERSE